VATIPTIEIRKISGAEAHDERNPEHRGHVTPHREHPGAERPGRRIGAREGDRTQVTGISKRVFLGDHPAHGDAHEVKAGNAERVGQGLRVVGEHPAGVRAGRL
jgi:hypothetical protein